MAKLTAEPSRGDRKGRLPHGPPAIRNLINFWALKYMEPHKVGPGQFLSFIHSIHIYI